VRASIAERAPVGRLNPKQTINYRTSGAIAAYRIVRHGGANVRVLGVAQESGVVGDIGSVKLAPGSLQG
jgi:hypothetical protein